MLKKVIGIFGICTMFLQPISGMEDNTVDHSRIKKILADNSDLLNSSQNKDIIVFLGSTGAGKSTVINYISDKKLKADREVVPGVWTV